MKFHDIKWLDGRGHFKTILISKKEELCRKIKQGSKIENFYSKLFGCFLRMKVYN